MAYESGPKPSDFDLEDYRDETYYSLLLQIPKDLRGVHMSKCERQGMSAEEIFSYLTETITKRKEAVTKTGISEERFKKIFSETPQLLTDLETTIYDNKENYLGSGTTAKVKSFEITTQEGGVETVAVKYIVYPKPGTKSAEEEHDILREVRFLTVIEKLEDESHIDKEIIRVPHPYFHHSTDKIQCYGMECIDGYNIQQLLNEPIDPEFKKAVKDSPFMKRDVELTYAEIEKFFHATHKYCLHGDIKDRNIMISRTGTIYVIDFGQARLNTDIFEKDQEALENLREEEIRMAKNSTLRAIVYLMQKLQAE